MLYSKDWYGTGMEEVAMIDDFGPSGTPPMIGKMLTPMEWLGYIAS